MVITYTVSETGLSGVDTSNYSTTVSGDASTVYTFTNTNTETVTVQVSKSFDGGTTIPQSVVIGLYSNGSSKVGELSLTADNNWTDNFTNVSKYGSDGSLITYTIKELAAYDAKGSDVAVFWTPKLYQSQDDPYIFVIVNTPSGHG